MLNNIRRDKFNLLYLITTILIGSLLAIGGIFGSINLSDIGTILGVWIAIYAVFYSRRTVGPSIEIVKDNINALYFMREDKHSDKYHGSIRFPLIFYNSGDKMSVIIVEEMAIQNYELSPSELYHDKIYSIEPQTHLLVEFNIMFSKVNVDAKIKLKSPLLLKIKYDWVKDGNIIHGEEILKVNCEFR